MQTPQSQTLEFRLATEVDRDWLIKIWTDQKIMNLIPVPNEVTCESEGYCCRRIAAPDLAKG